MTCHSYNVVNRAPSPYTHCDQCSASLESVEPAQLVACQDGWFCDTRCYQAFIDKQQPVAILRALLFSASRMLSRVAAVL